MPWGWGYGSRFAPTQKLKQWWIDQDGVYSARGRAGQYIFVVPESELVAVFTGNWRGVDYSELELLLDIFVIRAATSTEALPPHPDGVELLESSMQAAATASAGPETVAPLPEVAQRVSGKTYLLDTPNPTGYASISFTFGEGAEAMMTLGYVPEDAPMSGEDSPALVQVEVPLGLDDVYRFSPAEFGIMMGAKGEWVAEDVFLVHLDLIGNTGFQRARITFEGKQIIVDTWDDSQIPAVRMSSFAGRLAE